MRAEKASYRVFYSWQQEKQTGFFNIYSLKGVSYKVTELKSTDEDSGWNDAVYLGEFQESDIKFVKHVKVQREFKL